MADREIARTGNLTMETKLLTLKELAASLNRSTVYLTGLQKRFELPALGGAAYSPAYVAFLRGLKIGRAHV